MFLLSSCQYGTRLSLVTISVLIAGCATPVEYYPDAEQPVHDTARHPVPKGVSIVEFTTNTLEPATFLHVTDDNPCETKGGSDAIAAFVRRQRVVPKYEEQFRAVGNLLTFGLADAMTRPATDTPYKKRGEYPSGAPIRLAASSFIAYPNQTVSCGPLFLSFIPEEKKHYSLTFVRAGEGCNLSISELQGSAQMPVPHSRWSCSKGFLGFGPSQQSNLREVNGGGLARPASARQ